MISFGRAALALIRWSLIAGAIVGPGLLWVREVAGRDRRRLVETHLAARLLGIWVMFLVWFGWPPCLLWSIRPSTGPGERWEIYALLLLGIPTALVLLCFLLVIFRSIARRRDPILNAALKRAAEGDARGAFLTLLRESRKGPGKATWSNQLGVFLLDGGATADSVAYFEEAELLDGKEPLYRSNRAFALARLGRLAEAIEVFEDIRRERPFDPCLEVVYSRALSEAGLFEEATAQLERAEACRRPPYLARADRDAFDLRLRECRAAIETRAVDPESEVDRPCH